ncbi:MAG: TIGR02444 family protein [Alphaproteobacteria bacterium]|nr:TIGR02444 family protein [Alphaproteobacteria bacterium]
MTDFPPTEFWDFSLAVYGHDGVAEACLGFQDNYGVDVNLLLFCAWMGASGRGHVGGPDLYELSDMVEDWHHSVVRYLRTLRTDLRDGHEPFPDILVESVRRRLQKVEIDTEHAEQVVLASWADDRPPHEVSTEQALIDADSNMMVYLGALTPRPSTGDHENVEIILSGCAAWLSDRAEETTAT